MPSSDTHVSRSRVFPAVRSPPSSSALSIIDSSVSNYTTCGALFGFPAPTSPFAGIYSPDVLTRSLELVLTRYPQLCGTLRLVEYDPTLARNDHTKRFGRVELLWGGEHHRGLDLVFATRSGAVSSILPRQAGTGPGTGTGVYDVSSADRDLFVSPDAIVRLRGPDEGRGAIGVKVTTFSEGGISIAVGMHHTLGDAQTLSLFVGDWAMAHRSLLAGEEAPLDHIPLRPFEPLRLDGYAAGNVDAAEEDGAILDEALRVPQIRLDFWSSDEGKPPMISSPSRPPPEVAGLDEAMGRRRGTRIPWETWEWAKPVKDYLIDFSPDEVQRIWESAAVPTSSGSVGQTCDAGDAGDAGDVGDVGDVDAGAGAGGSSGAVSRLDAVLAHVWRIVTRSRGNEGLVHLDMSLGLRNRLTPALPPAFLGSPIINLTASLQTSSLLSSLPAAARSIRSTIISSIPFLPALIHHEAFALDPIREWNAFMGKEHLMVTSWLGIGAGEVDFGDGPAEWVCADMWPIDGLVVLMDKGTGRGWSEPRKTRGEDGRIGSGERLGNGRWHDNGVTIRLVLTEDDMAAVLADPDLRPRL
ncbi:hypothetical protein JCM24511_06087 [Saitozyma sp. JCM 24511]|nr:hypothetical protein JCM24511_06087 [Saitozyma sp. JCM 24511]